MQGQIVALYLETMRCQVFHMARARVHRIHAITGYAMEVVMVVMDVAVGQFTRRFVPCGLPRQVNAHDRFTVKQIFQLPVNRGQAQRGYCTLRQLADLLGHQGPATLRECTEDGIALACMALHASILLQMQTHLQ